MSSFASLALPLFIGGLIGLVFFLGLRETVRRIPEAKNPHVLMIISFALRSLLAMTGFMILMNGQWERMAAAVAGFFIAKIFMIHFCGITDNPTSTGAVSWKL